MSTPRDCSVCMYPCEEAKEAEERVISLTCGHVLHLMCIQGWVLQFYTDGEKTGPPTCPVCRSPLEERDVGAKSDGDDILTSVGSERLVDVMVDTILPAQKNLLDKTDILQNSIDFHTAHCPVHNGSYLANPILWVGTNFHLVENTRNQVVDLVFERFRTTGAEGSDEPKVVFHIQQDGT